MSFLTCDLIKKNGQTDMRYRFFYICLFLFYLNHKLRMKFFRICFILYFFDLLTSYDFIMAFIRLLSSFMPCRHN